MNNLFKKENEQPLIRFLEDNSDVDQVKDETFNFICEYVLKI